MSAKNIKRDTKGRFCQIYRKWSLSNFNEGYIRAPQNRFWVYFPKHLRANKQGWIQRSIVAYELYNKDIVRDDFIIHHINNNRLDDSKENLMKLKFGEHTRLHWKGRSRKGQNEHLKKGKYLICVICKKEFYRPQWVINHNRAKYNFCSIKCRDNRKGIIDIRR